MTAENDISIADAIAAVREAVIPYRSQYAVGLQYKADDRLRAAIAYLIDHERVVTALHIAIRDNRITERERDIARAKLALLAALALEPEPEAKRDG